MLGGSRLSFHLIHLLPSLSDRTLGPGGFHCLQNDSMYEIITFYCRRLSRPKEKVGTNDVVVVAADDDDDVLLLLSHFYLNSFY